MLKARVCHIRWARLAVAVGGTDGDSAARKDTLDPKPVFKNVTGKLIQVGPGRRTTGGEAGFTHAQRERRRPIPEVLRDSVKDVGECGVRGVERLYHPFKSMPLNSKLPGSSS
ncbi:uncharacterized protein LOC144579231 isoform X2 [Callithrix jacchus]